MRQNNGAPNHPQTQGKVDRFHQTLKQWLTARPRARTTHELQTQLTTFREHYNERRPHRSLTGHTPAQAFAATPKAVPSDHADTAHYRLRYDRVSDGKISFRRAGRMHHLGIGTANNGKRVLAIADDTTVTVTHLTTGGVLSTHDIDPDRGYWRNKQREPGRWPGSR
ncbi:integrase core domain-containing protein [Gulosibacter sediminis]|uniref:integrase core domain-containing protein n=1 Tax=Gulosibacter sediminis TaxID=1729695 RepID=UPI003D157A82